MSKKRNTGISDKCGFRKIAALPQQPRPFCHSLTSRPTLPYVTKKPS